MDLNDIIELIYNNYVNDEAYFNDKLFKKEHDDLYKTLMDKFDNINDVIIYLSLNKKNNKFINSLNDLKNYLVLNYLEENKINGKTYKDMIKNTDFNVNQIRILHQNLKKYFNIKDKFE